MDSMLATVPLRVLLVGDASFCRSLTETLSASPVEIVAKANTLDDALHAAELLIPHVALLDEEMSEAAHLMSDWTSAVVVRSPADDAVAHAHRRDRHAYDAGFLQVVMRLATVAPPRALVVPGRG